MTHITKYLHFPKKKITHIKRDCPKSHFISKNSSITSCHLLLSLPEGKHPEWGREYEAEPGRVTNLLEEINRYPDKAVSDLCARRINIHCITSI